AITATYRYDAYGNTTATTDPGVNPFRYAGQYTDTRTGLIYMRARWYDPATGSFLTRDPLEAVTQEPYGYVGGDPLNRVDPDGMKHRPKDDGFDWKTVYTTPQTPIKWNAVATPFLPFPRFGRNFTYLGIRSGTSSYCAVQWTVTGSGDDMIIRERTLKVLLKWQQTESWTADFGTGELGSTKFGTPRLDPLDPYLISVKKNSYRIVYEHGGRFG
ncbi:MAG TPA: RHS repeat-associated core domain-containing protein, partial [Acidimicrobiales bacterium]|nr:RHS repeat-associated core domain-containing protein [Acidimicrobiales bacterium]